MKRVLLGLSGFVLLATVVVAAQPVNPYTNNQPFKPRGALDKILVKHWQEKQLKPALTCSDAAFLRRVYVDLTGTLPPVARTKAFLVDQRANKRELAVEELLKSENFALYFSLKWCDILRVKSEFPINMWPNAVQAYHEWVLESLKKNKPYDKFARKLLTTSGSNFREPAVNFYRGTRDRTPAGLARITAQTFLCSRTEGWPEAEQKEFAKLFSRIAFKRTDEWKEQIVYLNPEPVDAFTVTMPNGDKLDVPADKDPRDVLAAWLTSPKNTWFAQAAVNRCWFWIFGRGIVNEPDDFRLGKNDSRDPFWKGALRNNANPAASQELLEHLAAEFIKSGYDFKALCQMIVNSAVYQQSCVPGSPGKTAEANLAVYPVRRLDAEVLIDTFTHWGNLNTRYMSVIPEPFTYIPPWQRTIGLADGSISSAFLETFGRPARDTGRLMERNNQVTYSQRLYLLNSPDVLWRVGNGPVVKELLRTTAKTPRTMVIDAYMLVLGRRPTVNEWSTLIKRHPQLKSNKVPRGKGGKQAIQNAGRSLIWALINSKEFLFQH